MFLSWLLLCLWHFSLCLLCHLAFETQAAWCVYFFWHLASLSIYIYIYAICIYIYICIFAYYYIIDILVSFTFWKGQYIAIAAPGARANIFHLIALTVHGGKIWRIKSIWQKLLGWNQFELANCVHEKLKRSVFNSVFQRFFGPRAWRSKNEVPERRVELVRRAEPPGEKHVVSVEWKYVCLRVSRRFQGWISHSLTVAQTNSVKHNRAVNHLPLKLDFHFSLSSKHITCYSTRWKGLPGLGKCLLCSTHPQTILST